MNPIWDFGLLWIEWKIDTRIRVMRKKSNFPYSVNIHGFINAVVKRDLWLAQFPHCIFIIISLCIHAEKFVFFIYVFMIDTTISLVFPNNTFVFIKS